MAKETGWSEAAILSLPMVALDEYFRAVLKLKGVNPDLDPGYQAPPPDPSEPFDPELEALLRQRMEE